MMDVLYDTFGVPTPTPKMVVPRCTSKRKRKRVESLSPDLNFKIVKLNTLY